MSIFCNTILMYYIIITTFNVAIIKSLKSAFDDPKFVNLPFIYDREMCLPGETDKMAWHVFDNFGIKDGADCYSGASDIKTYECMALCQDDSNCHGIIRLKVDDGRPSICWIIAAKCDFLSATQPNKEYTTYYLETCNVASDIYRYLPDLYFTPFIFNPKTQCQKARKNVDITACDYISWHLQENTDLSVSPYHTKVNLPAHLCMNECFQDDKCSGIIEEHVAPFGWNCHFYNQIQGKSDKKLNKILYEKICCPMQRVDNAKDKLILYAPYIFFCHQHIPYNRNCLIKFWMVRNNRKVKGQFNTYPLVSIQDCLLKCLDETNCVAVNIDQYEYRCLVVIRADNFIVAHTKFTLYKLACCNETDTPESIEAVKQKNSEIREPKRVSGSKLGIFSIIAIIIAVLLLIALFMMCPFYFLCWKRCKKENKADIALADAISVENSDLYSYE